MKNPQVEFLDFQLKRKKQDWQSAFEAGIQVE